MQETAFETSVAGYDLDCYEEIERAWASDMKRATAVRHYPIRRAADGGLLARANVLWVWVDLESGRPIRIPAEFQVDFGPSISSVCESSRQHALASSD